MINTIPMQTKLYFVIIIFILIGCASMPPKSVVSSPASQFEVHYYLYQPVEQKLKRTVIIFPPTGGITYLEKSYAREIRQRGAQVIVLSGWTGQDEDNLDWGLHQRLHKRAMKALEMTLELVPEGHKISLMGTSVGALFTAVAANKFEQIDKVLGIAGGIPISKVIAESEYKTMKSLRKRRKKTFGVEDKNEYAKQIDQVFYLEPEKLPSLYQQKKRALVIMIEDEAVPTRYQQYFLDYWKPQKTIKINAGHFWGIIKAWWFHFEEIVDFLVED